MSYFDKDIKQGLPTRFCELFAAGPIATLYGWEAMRDYSDAAIKSQFQVVLGLQDNPHIIGFWLFAFGLACTMLSVSRFKVARLIVNAGLVIGWAIVCVIFLTFKLSGLPLGIGTILSLTSIVVCCTIVQREAQNNSSGICV